MRLALKDNPHLYESPLTSPGEYDDQFRTDAVENLLAREDLCPR